MKKKDILEAEFYQKMSNITNSQEENGAEIEQALGNFSLQLEECKISDEQIVEIWQRISSRVTQLGENRSQNFDQAFSEDMYNHEILTRQESNEEQLTQYRTILLIRLQEWSDEYTREYVRQVNSILAEELAPCYHGSGAGATSSGAMMEFSSHW